MAKSLGTVALGNTAEGFETFQYASVVSSVQRYRLEREFRRDRAALEGLHVGGQQRLKVGSTMPPTP